MTDKLFKQFRKYSKVRPRERQELAGILGLPVASETVSVPGRNGYVYVRLRNTNEIVQVFNDRVSAVYNLPVLLEWADGRYKIISRDTERYQNWGESSPFLPEHGHYFEPWITVQDEGLVVGTGTTLNFVGDNVEVSMVGNVARVFITGSTMTEGANKELSNLNPTAINADLTPSSNMTGTLGDEFFHWKEAWLGDVLLRTQTGTATPPFNTSKLWADTSGIVHSKRYGGSDSILLTDAPSNGLLYARKDGTWAISSGTSGGGIAGIVGQNEGAVVGTGTILNFVGDNVDVTISGSVMRVFVTGSVGAGNPPITGSVVVSDDSAIQGSALTLNFGDNLSATISGSVAQIDVTNFPDPPAPVNTDGVIIWNEGAPLGTGSVLNFVGDNIDVTMSGSVARVFVTGSSGGGGGWQLIDEQFLSTTGTILFSSIPPTYTQLRVVGRVRSNAAASADRILFMVGNGGPSFSPVYDYVIRREGQAQATARSNTATGITEIIIPGADAAEGYYGLVKYVVDGYAEDHWKDMELFGGHTEAQNERICIGIGTWRDNAVVDTALLQATGSDSLISGSYARLYGL